MWLAYNIWEIQSNMPNTTTHYPACTQKTAHRLPSNASATSPGSKASSAASPSSRGLHSRQISSLFRGISASPHPPLARPSCLWLRRAPTRREPRLGGSDASILPGLQPRSGSCSRLLGSASAARPSPGPAATIRAASAGVSAGSARTARRAEGLSLPLGARREGRV